MRFFSRPDFALLHPPSVYDFRQMLRIPSPVADLVPSSPVFEMYPLGLSFLGEYLEKRGFNVRIVNLATRMLEEPGFKVEKLISSIDPVAFGISLHWLPSCHGALEIACLCKKIHPRTPVVLGGYSATQFHRELMNYPQIDYIVRGDSTEEPVFRLLSALTGEGELGNVPNLTYREAGSGRIVENDLSYVPGDLEHLGDNYRYMLKSALKYGDIRSLRAFKDWWSYPLTAVLTCRGCKNNCSFCGGSAWTMSSCFQRGEVAFRTPESVAGDVATVCGFTGAPIFIIGDIRQAGDRYAAQIIESLGRISPRNHVVLELFSPAPQWFFEKISSNLPNFDLEISPESHDEGIRKAAGKSYSNRELEQNILWAVESGCSRLDVFFMIGLSGQTRQSVMDTVSYCSYLLDKYGSSVNPLIGPLAPFLDEGSIFNERAGEYGYRIIFHSLEEYRRALLSLHWRDALSYETRWMTRQDIVDATYVALLELNRVKGKHGLISTGYMEKMEKFLHQDIALLDSVDEAAGIDDPASREAAFAKIGENARLLQEEGSLVKEEIKWPLVGRKFHYLNILRVVMGR